MCVCVFYEYFEYLEILTSHRQNTIDGLNLIEEDREWMKQKISNKSSKAQNANELWTKHKYTHTANKKTCATT